MLPTPNLTLLARGALAVCALSWSIVAPAAAARPSVGLSPVRTQSFADENLGGYVAASGDHFAVALAVGDFNHDGAEDLATGVPNHDNSGGLHPDSGIVIVSYGVGRRGLAGGQASTVLSQDAPGSPDPAEDGDHFGAGLAACDFNGDGFDDLAVGIPGEDLPIFNSAAGAVQVHFGSPAGLAAAGDLFFSESTTGVPGSATSGDNFGSTLACGLFNPDEFFDLAIGVPREDLAGPHTDAGMVVVVPGSVAGPAVAAASGFDQDSPGMDGASASFDNFGAALAVGDFNGDLLDDLAIGIPGEVNGGSNPDTWMGAVQVVYGSLSGLTVFGNLRFRDGEIGGLSTNGDQFGSALAAGDFDLDGKDDLAIGIPFSDLGGNTIVDAGQVAVVYGTATGFDGSQHWFQENIAGTGTSEADDRFGFALAVGDLDRDGYADLAAGSPSEFVLVAGDGVVTAWMGTPAGLTATRNRSFARGYEGLPGPINEAAREFGHTLAIGDFDGDAYDDLVIGAPFANVTLQNLGDEVVMFGALFADGFESAAADFWSSVTP